MNRLFILVMVFSFIMLVSAYAQTEVWTAQDLYNVRQNLYDDYVQMADINLINYPWTPIGSLAFPFEGTYDGNGFVIKNMNNQIASNYVGLFGVINGAVLSSVKIHDSTIYGISDVGMLVGHSLSSTISGCEVNSSDPNNLSFVGGKYNVGGLIGYSEDTNIIGSRTLSDITVTQVRGDESVGGLIGKSHLSTINNCTAISDVRAVELGQFQEYIGGLIGQCSYTTINLSMSSGYVEGKYNIGGLVGYSINQSSITSSRSIAIVNGHNSVGGLVGALNEMENPDYETYVDQSYSYGSVTGNTRVGGLAGLAIKSAISMSYSSSVVTGTEMVGGLAGNCFMAHVSHSYSTGKVIGDLDVGGLIGAQTYSVFDLCYWDKESSGVDVSAGGNGRDTVQMVQESTFTGWGFQNFWTIPEVNPYTRIHYPILQWQEKPGSYNEIANAIVKVFEGRRHNWESFPRLLQQNHFPSTVIALQDLAGDPLHTVSERVGQYEYQMVWDQDDGWLTPYISFRSEKGYKLSFLNESEHFMYVSGDHIDLEQTITLYEGVENWVGYFLPHNQHVYNAIDSQVLDQIDYIQSEEWSMHNTGSSWLFSVNTQDPTYPVGYLAYGKMYVIGTSVPDSLCFEWNIPTQTSASAEISKMQQPEYFTYIDGPDYESFFIEDIEDDEDVTEIGVFVGDECIGATVFHGFYPVEVLAFTNESHLGQDLTFAIHRESQRGDFELLRSAEIKDLETGEFTAQTIKPLRRRFTVIRLGTGEGEIEPVVKPLISLAQNYPNPFVLSTESRSNMTEIPFYVSEPREVALSVFNIKGQKVSEVYSGSVSAGKHSISWNGYSDSNHKVSSGIYFYRLETGDEVMTRKMLIVR
jgi:hypothetical protein